MSNLIKLATAGMLSLFAATSTALAGSVTQPGETVGLAVGAPLPEGLYFVNTADWGCRNTNPNSTCVGVDIPIIAWSTPWHLLGARVQLVAATPVIEVGVHDTTYLSSIYNPIVAGQLAWDLGNGWGVSYLLGAYFRVGGELAWDSTSLNQRFAISYTGNGWNLTANVIYGIQFDHVGSKPQISGCPLPLPFNSCNPDFINVDLTATKKFNKWELGVVAFGSSDLTRPIPTYLKQSQFAVGGLVGYDFGPVVLQGYVTTDVAETNYGGHDTRGWARIIIPIWNPPPASPVIGKSGLVTKG
jgi:outer membrane putative beta-barrel porin/alpha-amylase